MCQSKARLSSGTSVCMNVQGVNSGVLLTNININSNSYIDIKMVELYLEQHPVVVHIEEVFPDARAGTLALGVGLLGLVTVPPTPDMAQLYTTARP